MHEFDRESLELAELIDDLPQALALVRSELGQTAGGLEEMELQRVYRAGVFRQLNQRNRVETTAAAAPSPQVTAVERSS